MPPERLVLLLTLLCCPPVLAGAPAPDDAGNKAREPEVSIELLEFLGGWETATGPWNETIPDADAAQPARRPKESARD